MKAKAIPEGFHTITPYFSVRNAFRFIEFLKQAFDAKDTYVVTLPDGTLLSAEVQAGDSMVIIGEDDTGASSRQADAQQALYVTSRMSMPFSRRPFKPALNPLRNRPTNSEVTEARLWKIWRATSGG